MKKEQAKEFFEAAAKDEASLERRRGMEPAAAAGKDGEAADADLSAAAGGSSEVAELSSKKFIEERMAILLNHHRE